MSVSETNRQYRKDVPIEQTWDLTDLFPDKESWEKALKEIVEEVDQITAFKGKISENANTLLEAIQTAEAYQQKVIHVAVYANLLVSADGSDPANQGAAAKSSSALATISSKLSFFETELLELTSSDIEQFIKDEPKLETYRKYLLDILEKKDHILSPELEEALSALGEVLDAPYSIFSRSKQSDMQFESVVDGQGNTQPMSEPLYEESYEYSEDTTLRRNAYDAFVNTLEQYKNTYAATYATEITKQVQLSKLRKYDSVTDMLLAPQQVTTEMYHNQLDVIQEKLAPHMQKYAKLLKEKLGLDELRFCDLKAPLDPSFNPSTSYEESSGTILNALDIMGPEYVEGMKKALSNRWVDRAENVGKASGAFCSSPYGAHPYILVTWADKMRNAFILAHELGHAGHFYLAGKNQTLFNTRPSTYFIEAPSTLNELLLADHLMDKNQDNPRMKRWIITQLLGTYYHNFVTHLLEGAFQRKVYDLAEEGIPLTADVLCKEKRNVLESFWGDTVTFDDGAGLTWMRQPHYYMGLYPYTYSAGLTVSTTMAKRIREEGQPAVQDWLNVLKSGGTKQPLDLIKDAGINMSNPKNIETAVDYVGSLIDELAESYSE
ncbi:oligoendopeptidase F [Oceanobacillus jeddahense]|uniref:Oligopeptidase F n=1 Tax=Oceanobacillus jeddahense TaxID=1462527 RepID=A0ABY5JYK4_9BACI|nr:oligoendopeptidase F [Oceanobacillus jeddahense]UUI05189.1 oligoendopeptidase F [Oceanobacillus jeddahense]